MVIINSVFWFYNFETLKLGDNKQDVIIYGVIIDRSDCIYIIIYIYFNQSEFDHLGGQVSDGVKSGDFWHAP